MAEIPTYDLQQKVKKSEKQAVELRQMDETLPLKAEERNLSHTALENPHLVDDKYSIKDLIDMESLHKTLKDFSRATGFPAALVAYPSQEIFIHTGRREICAKFHRAFPESLKYCKKSNLYLTEQLKGLKKLSIKKCGNGLVDGATPIVIKGKHLASLFTGQVFFEKPDMERFEKQAEAYGYDLDAYSEALGKVPIVSEEQFENTLSFLKRLAVTIAKTGLDNLELTEKTRTLRKEIMVRKHTEEALRESEEKYRDLVNNTTDLIYRTDMEGKVTFASPSIYHLSGFTVEEAIGMKMAEDLYAIPEERAVFLAKLQEDGNVENFEAQLKRKDGSIWWVSTNAHFFKDQNGNINGVEGITRDITLQKKTEKERKNLEMQLRRAQKMEAIGTLAGGIAHDFNNLLMAIQSRTSIALMNKDSSHPDYPHLTGIENCVESASGLTRQLLGFARGGKYEVKPTDLNELIKKENRMFGRTKKEISIREELEVALWSAEVDRGQIQQVLLNLYVNAWQAMPNGGTLYIRAENVRLDENYTKPYWIEPGRYIQISVTDTGVGMDKATQEKIFDPFFTTKEMGRGTGLGLASAYGIIKNHDGFINVYSEKDHGSTFNVYLPASEKEIIEVKKPVGDTLKGFETVLFVDDEDMITEIAEDLLELLGYKTLIARSGKEAIEIYEKNKGRIDMVILDMIMPDMSGGETYEKIKEINPEVKVLLSSGYSIDGRATEILDRGCRGFIQKPFKMKELSQRLRKILDKK